MLMQKCNCGYETGKKNFNFCPLCGTKLTILKLEKDETYKAERKACRVVDEWCDSKKIYYYKESSFNKEYAWIYKYLHDDAYFMFLHISKIKPLELERIEKCVFRKNNECGHAVTCKGCSVCTGKLEETIMQWIRASA